MQKLDIEGKEIKGMEHNQEVKIGEFQEKSTTQRTNKFKKKVHTAFGCMRVMVNLAREVLEGDRNGNADGIGQRWYEREAVEIANIDRLLKILCSNSDQRPEIIKEEVGTTSMYLWSDRNDLIDQKKKKKSVLDGDEQRTEVLLQAKEDPVLKRIESGAEEGALTLMAESKLHQEG